MPPIKVTHREAPQAVAKARRWQSLAAVTAAAGASGPDPKTSGAKTTPTVKNATAVRKRVDHAIGKLRARDKSRVRVREEDSVGGERRVKPSATHNFDS